MTGRQLYDLIQTNRKASLFDSRVTSRSADILSNYIHDEEVAKQLLKNKVLEINVDDLPTLSDFVKKFISKLVGGLKVAKALDPWANLGELLYLVQSTHPTAKLVGFNRLDDLYKLNKKLSSSISFKLGSPFDLLKADKNFYDLIISNMPVGLSNSVTKHGMAKSDLGLQLIIECLDRLSDSGILLATVGPTFFYSSNSEKFRNVVVGKGFNIVAIFGAPLKSINPNASVPFYLTLIARGPQGLIFLADIDEDEARQMRIVSNFKKLKTSENISEGILIPSEEIKPIQAISLQKELELLLRQTGLPLVSINDLGSFVPPENLSSDCIIIPKNPYKKIGLGRTAEDVDRNWNFIFEVNTSIADPVYLVEFLNGGLGNKILNHKAQGAIMPLLNGKNVKEILLPIPPLAKQKEIIATDRIIKNTQEVFLKFHNNLWTNPSRQREIDKAIKSALKDTNSIEWLEDLPFPLASILWGHYSEARNGKKVEYLFLFFEALCQFLDTLIISALITNKTFFNNTVKNWIKSDKKDWHLKASFGGWRYMFENLSKNIRTIYADTKERDFILEILGQPDEGYVSLITSKLLASAFLDVNQLRNDYKGHGGVTSENSENELLERLESKLYAIREELVSGFANVSFINPVPSAMDWDSDLQVFNSTCKLLKGSRNKFQQIKVQTIRQVSSKKLYVLHNNRFTPIEVIGIVQVREAPKSKQNACFFYNRIEKNKVRLVSYHFDAEPEIYEDVASIEQALFFINPRN